MGLSPSPTPRRCHPEQLLQDLGMLGKGCFLGAIRCKSTHLLLHRLCHHMKRVTSVLGPVRNLPDVRGGRQGWPEAGPGASAPH